ncbi:MAG: hypothetical protein WAZ36_11855 [Sediminibacterium sp.]
MCQNESVLVDIYNTKIVSLTYVKRKLTPGIGSRSDPYLFSAYLGDILL